MWNGLVLIIITIVAAYIIFAALLYTFQGSLIYFPARTLDATPDQYGMRYEPVSFQAEDGVMLFGWYLPARHPRGNLLFLHGNGGNISHRVFSLQQFNRLGLNTFIFDYRGYGQSEGKPSEIGTYRDAEAAWHYLTATRGLDPDRIIVFGRSLGAAIASYLATKHLPRALIIEAAFTSVPDLAAKFYPFMPVRWLTRFSYDTAGYVARITCPVLVVHSRDDDIIPFAHGQRVFSAASQPKEFLEIRGTHNDAFIVTGKLYEDGLDRFLVNAAALAPIAAPE
ncbi:MAG: alpha/beta hydrolase [Acidiferrobacterales bacterium]